MNIYKVKFGEKTGQESYTDDTKIGAANMIEAAEKAKGVSERRIREWNESFEMDSTSSDSEEKQRADSEEAALESLEVTSIEFEGSLEEP